MITLGSSSPSTLVGASESVLETATTNWPGFIIFAAVVLSIAITAQITLTRRAKMPPEKRALRTLSKRAGIGRGQLTALNRLAAKADLHPIALILSGDALVRARVAAGDDSELTALADRLAASA